MKYRIIIIFSLIIVNSQLTYAQSCNINGKEHYNFSDIKLILDKNNCNDCHHSGSYQSSWNYDTYTNIFKGSNCDNKIIKQGRPNESTLIDKINGGPTLCGNAMPLGKNKINGADLLAIESWITFGAPEYCIPVFEEIRDILIKNKCATCHSKNENWSFDSYTSVFYKPTNSICTDNELIRYNALESLLYKKISVSGINLCGQPMLVEGVKMAERDISKIRDWINAGAPESYKVLPVSLSVFYTENLKNEKILVAWKTGSEINTSHFEIEHSKDGVKFVSVGKIQSSGIAGSGKFYSFNHEEINIGFNYYRLKIIDFDNSFSYSPIRIERISNASEIFSVYPNPVYINDAYNVEWYSTDGRQKVRMFLMDITGKLCMEYVLSNGLNVLQLNQQKAGVYYLSVEDYNFNRIIRKIVILDQ